MRLEEGYYDRRRVKKVERWLLFIEGGFLVWRKHFHASEAVLVHRRRFLCIGRDPIAWKEGIFMVIFQPKGRIYI